MKKFLMYVLVLVISVLCLTSCKDTELIARVDGLENKVNELENKVIELVSKVEEMESFRLSESFYGSIYKLDERSWNHIVEFYNAHEECQHYNSIYARPEFKNAYSWDIDEAYAEAYPDDDLTYDEERIADLYRYGMEYYLDEYQATIAFRDNGTLTLTSEGAAVDMAYTMMGNDIMVGYNSLALIFGEEPSDSLESVKYYLGTLSEDKNTVILSSDFMTLGLGVLYLQ